jgi:predicted amidohydrolase
MRVAVIQMNSAAERDENVARALALVGRAAAEGAQLVALPEYMTFLGPYRRFAEMSEPVPGPTTDRLADAARRHCIYLHGGSLIERSPVAGRYYNTSTVFDPQGELIATYRKVHLFDVNIPGQVTDTESRAILPGDALRIVSLSQITLGMSICFDLRFPELYRALAAAGAEVFAVPAAFARATGRVHWEVLLRARAIENHAYVLAAAQHGQAVGGGWRYGRSMIIDPWGQVLAAAAEEGEEVLIADIRREIVVRRRHEMPVLTMRRPDIYGSLGSITAG